MEPQNSHKKWQGIVVHLQSQQTPDGGMPEQGEHRVLTSAHTSTEVNTHTYAKKAHTHMHTHMEGLIFFLGSQIRLHPFDRHCTSFPH